MRPSEAADIAREALAQGNATLARSITERLLAKFPRYPPARLVRALLAEQANDSDAALDDLRAVTSAEPTNAEARAAQARLFQQRGDTDRARVVARQAIELVPTNAHVLESALEILNIDADSLEASAAVLARVHLNCGWSDLAERHARVAVSESPERVDVRLTLAEALWRLGRLHACETECRVVADQAEQCVRAAVMRAHILSERGRTAEGQELLDRIGEIDPEFREARELLGTLEFHRLVLPNAADVALPQELLGQTDGSTPLSGQPTAADEAQPAAPAETVGAGRAHIQPNEGPDAPDGLPVRHPEAPDAAEQLPAAEARPETVAPGGEASPGAHPERGAAPRGQIHRADGTPDSELQEALEPSGDPAASEPPTGGTNPATTQAESATGATLSTFDWARDLIERSEWTEAERVLTDIVTANDPDAARVDGLLLEAVAHRELRGSAWKLLGDHYMQTGRPQAAADAYLRAANVAGQSTR